LRRIILGALIGVSILTVLFVRVDLRQLREVFLDVYVPFLMIGLALRVFVMWLKSVRWAGVIHRATGRPVRRAFGACMIGLAGNILLPVRLGEVARTIVIDKHNQTGRSLAVATIAVTYLLDLLFLVSIFSMISFWSWSVLPVPIVTLGVLAIVILLVVSGLAILQRISKPWNSALLPVGRILPGALTRRIANHAALFSRGFAILRHAGAIRQFLVLTIAIWGLETIAVYSMLLAFQIKANLLIAATLLVVVTLSFIFPISPGNVGVVQALSILVLGSYGITQEAAFAYSIGVQTISYLVIVCLGVVYFYQEKMNLGLIRRLAREDGERVPGVSLEA